MGLALIKADEGEDMSTFRKVGLLRWVKPELFFGTDEQLVVMV